MEELIPIFGIIFAIGVPVTALAVRFVIHPMLKDLVQAVRGRTLDQEQDLLQRMARLEEIVHGQAQTIERLVEAEAFRRQLEEGRVASPPRTVRSPEERVGAPASSGALRGAAAEEAESI